MPELGEGDERPQGSPQFVVGQLRGQTQIFIRDLILRAVVPAEQNSHLKGRHFQIVTAFAVRELNLNRMSKHTWMVIMQSVSA